MSLQLFSLASLLLDTAQAAYRAPAIFVNHGPGSRPYFEPNNPDVAPLIENWVGATKNALFSAGRPRAILVVNAHWEENHVSISSYNSPPPLFDDLGPTFPHDLRYPARGDPEVSQMIAERFEKSDISFDIDTERGLDHGAYGPLYYILPEADIPVIQLSIVKGFDPATHYAIGRALESLRDEGVAIIGSGMTFHNSDGYSESESSMQLADSLEFASDITSALSIEDLDDRGARLEKWTSFAKARMNHAEGGDDHFVPLIVVAGATGGDTFSSVQFKYTPNAWLTGYYWAGSNDDGDNVVDDQTDDEGDHSVDPSADLDNQKEKGDGNETKDSDPVGSSADSEKPKEKDANETKDGSSSLISSSLVLVSGFLLFFV